MSEFSTDAPERFTSIPRWAAAELRLRDQFRLGWQLEPNSVYPFLRPCRNRVLIVADGGLDFSEADFGLAVFVRTLLDTPGVHVRHEITLAHIDDAPEGRLMGAENRIARRIPRFKFDDPGNFLPDMYDVVMLFGISPSHFGRGNDSDGRPYPSDRLADPELDALTAFMNGGGGLFATGDHGLLGRALCSAVPRARNMRLWTSTPVQEELDEVSMGTARRNDTNRGPWFDSQSDDIPQVIVPRMYFGGHIFPVRYPHPLLCGPRGVITVMPDHPHEGQCQEPPDTTGTMPDGTEEYPAASDGGDRPLPQVISTNSVPAGNLALVGGSSPTTIPLPSKDPTLGQTFGGICAYDGHRSGVGRVVTDATWHHFVNVNLVGMTQPSRPEFDRGFLSSPQGISHLEEIRAYYRNLLVWMSRAERIRCMNARLALFAIFDGKVLEAVMSSTEHETERVSSAVLRLIGIHARDVFGRAASRCQAIGFVVDLVLARAIPDLIPDIDPWRPRNDDRDTRAEQPSQWIDGSALVDIALGGALLAVRHVVGEPTEKGFEVDTDRILEIVAEGGARAVGVALRSLEEDLDRARKRFSR